MRNLIHAKNQKTYLKNENRWQKVDNSVVSDFFFWRLRLMIKHALRHVLYVFYALWPYIKSYLTNQYSYLPNMKVQSLFLNYSMETSIHPTLYRLSIGVTRAINTTSRDINLSLATRWLVYYVVITTRKSCKKGKNQIVKLIVF